MIFRERRSGSARPDSQREMVDGLHPSAWANSACVMSSARRMVRTMFCDSVCSMRSTSKRYARELAVAPSTLDGRCHGACVVRTDKLARRTPAMRRLESFLERPHVELVAPRARMLVGEEPERLGD